MNEPPQILVVDDQIGEVLWLILDLKARGYDVVQATNERVARKRLDAVRAGTERYRLAIIDIAVAILDIEDMVRERVKFDERFLAESASTGLRLCEYARKDLRLSEQELPIVCLSIRARDEEVRKRLAALGIQAFERDPQERDQSIRHYLDQNLTNQRASSTA